MFPLVEHNPGTTHIILAAFHLNDAPGNITLNDDCPWKSEFDALWTGAPLVKEGGMKVMGVLEGAAKGPFRRLYGTNEKGQKYYLPLQVLTRRYSVEGVHLDVEEGMSFKSIVRLIDRLKCDGRWIDHHHSYCGNRFTRRWKFVRVRLLEVRVRARFQDKLVEFTVL